MTITLDTWQPILVAVIGALAALGVPIVSAIIAARTARKAAAAAASTADTVSAIGGKVDDLSTTAEVHTRQLNAIGAAVNGERDAAQRKIQELEQRLLDRNKDVQGYGMKADDV